MRGNIITDPTDTLKKFFAQFVPKPQASNEKHFSVLRDVKSQEEETKIQWKPFCFVLQNAILCIF